MNIKRWIYILLFVLFFGCGEDQKPVVTISGQVDAKAVLKNMNAPVMVAVASTDDFSKIDSDPLNNIIKMVAVDKSDFSFSIDLSEEGVLPGTKVSVFAYVDNDFDGSSIYPGPGDFIGVYIDKGNLTASYIVKEGDNNLFLTINREVFDYTANISGTIECEDICDVTVIAYAGEITSLDFSELDFDAVVGYEVFSKKSKNALDYNLRIFPYGFNVPIENVYIFAHFDLNGNKKIDGGDKIGYYTDSGFKIISSSSGTNDFVSQDDNNLPTPVVINEGTVSGKNVKAITDVFEPSGYNISLKGDLTYADFNTDDPVYIIVAMSDDIDKLVENQLSSVIFFKRLVSGSKSFEIDLSSTILVPSDKIAVIALQDKDFNSGFPNPTEKDMIGFYADSKKLSMEYTIKNGENIGADIFINREVFTFKSKIKGSVNDNRAGDIIITAYAGSIDSMDFTAEIDINKVIGYKKIAKGSGFVDYELDILPYGINIPIENVYVFAILDNNKNGIPDKGDSIGYYYENSNKLPALINIDTGDINGVNIGMVFDIPESSSNNMSISGYFNPPQGYGNDSAPIFLIIADAGNPNALIDDPLSGIKYFSKIEQGEKGFYIDLSKSGIKQGEDVMIIALWDKDYAGGFPNLTLDDYVGYYQNNDEFLVSVELESGVNPISPVNGWDFNIDKKIYDHNSSISFSLERGGLPQNISYNTGDHVIVVAIHKGGVVLFKPNDIDYVIAMNSYVVDEKNEYILNILPSISTKVPVLESPFSLKDLYIYAVLDENRNGKVDTGESTGYYWQYVLGAYLPDMFDINDGINILDKTVRFTDEEF